MASRFSRREFLKTTSVAAASVLFLPRLGSAASTTANDKLNIGCIGVGGRGGSHLGPAGTQNLIALCDTDERRLGEAAKRFPRAKTFTDYRKLLDEMKDLDAVIVSTPDHSHFPAAMSAILLGRHVFVEKPLTHTVDEARRLAKAARDKKVATQMGNQGHCSDGIRRLVEYVDAGAIGGVTEIHTATNRPIWKQGMDRPKETPAVPPNLHWDVWLGPAPERPYNPAYEPFSWRGWIDFGCGALGDMGCHTMDGPVWAARLDKADKITIEAKTSGLNKESFPSWSIITYKFAAREGLPACTLTWYDGGKTPPRPAALEADRKFEGNGSYYVGEKGAIWSQGDYCESFRIVPEAKHQEYSKVAPPKSIPRVGGGVEADWFRACKGGPAACSNFEVSSRLAEIVLLGNVAVLAGQPIEYDAKEMKITNAPEANRLLKKEYRKGWDF